jgi:hypothetical protein
MKRPVFKKLVQTSLNYSDSLRLLNDFILIVGLFILLWSNYLLHAAQSFLRS